jgi:hypothetical protein
MQARTKFHPTITGAIYGRYKRFGDLTMDESFFPVTWRDGAEPSKFIGPYLEGTIGWAGEPSGGTPAGSPDA